MPYEPRVGDEVRYWSGFAFRESVVVRVTATQCHLKNGHVARKSKRFGWPSDLEMLVRRPAGQSGGE